MRPFFVKPIFLFYSDILLYSMTGYRDTFLQTHTHTHTQIYKQLSAEGGRRKRHTQERERERVGGIEREGERENVC